MWPPRARRWKPSASTRWCGHGNPRQRADGGRVPAPHAPHGGGLRGQPPVRRFPQGHDVGRPRHLLPPAPLQRLHPLRPLLQRLGRELGRGGWTFLREAGSANLRRTTKKAMPKDEDAAATTPSGSKTRLKPWCRRTPKDLGEPAWTGTWKPRACGATICSSRWCRRC